MGEQAPSGPGSKALRFGRFSQPGMVYLVTAVTHGRVPLFKRLDCARSVVQAIRGHDDQKWTETACYVLMPDHLHWMFQLGSEKSLSGLMRDFKGFTARRINRLAGRQGRPVWQVGFHDHALREHEDLRRMTRYVIRNPLRAGLVDNLRDYPHWDAWWFRPDRDAEMESGLLGL